MTQSQSRYSIVERLTQTKLDIMEEKAGMKNQLRQLEQNISGLQKDLENWEKDVKEDIKRTRRQKELQIQNATKKFQDFEDHMKDVEKSIEERIKTIDVALASIEEISKTSPTINK